MRGRMPPRRRLEMLADDPCRDPVDELAQLDETIRSHEYQRDEYVMRSQATNITRERTQWLLSRGKHHACRAYDYKQQREKVVSRMAENKRRAD
jgi:hypothetical protein